MPFSLFDFPPNLMDHSPVNHTSQQVIAIAPGIVFCYADLHNQHLLSLHDREYSQYRSVCSGFYLVMFVKDTLEKEVGIMVELCGAVWRNLQPTHKEILQSKCCPYESGQKTNAVN